MADITQAENTPWDLLRTNFLETLGGRARTNLSMVDSERLSE